MGKSLEMVCDPRALCFLTLIFLVIQFCPCCMAQQDSNKENHNKAPPMFPKPYQFNAPKKSGQPQPQHQQQQQQHQHHQPASFLPIRPPILPFALPHQLRHQPPPPPQQQREQLPSNHTFIPPSPPSPAVLDRLRLVLQKAGGVYRDPTKDPSLSRTVIITGTNYGYVNHLHNFKCFMDRLKLKVLVFSMDSKVHQHITDKMNPDRTPESVAGSAFYSFFWEGQGDKVQTEATEFRSKQFNIITHRKIEGIISVMEMNYDTMFVDVDIALIRDPMPYLRWRNVDYVHSHNRICPQHEVWDFFKSDEEGNTGFYYARTNEKTLKLWKDALALSPKYPELDDQSVFWIHIRETKDPKPLPLPHCGHFDNSTRTGKELVTCALDGCIFSAGALRGSKTVAHDWLRDALKKRNESVVVIHANYLKGNENKRYRMNQQGYWITGMDKDGNHKDGQCEKFVPKNFHMDENS